MTISQLPPERTATAAELAEESARIKRAVSGIRPPRTLHAMCEQAARLVSCTECGQLPGLACAEDGGLDAYHLGRFADARSAGLLTGGEMSEVVGAAGAFTSAAIVRDGAEVIPVPAMAAMRAQLAWAHARMDEWEQVFAVLGKARCDEVRPAGRPSLRALPGGAA